MKIIDLPFLHFFVRSGERGDGALFTPMETEDTSGAGSFFAPVQRDQTLFPVYRFHFSIYLGDGTYIEDTGDNKVLFTGVATATQVKSRDELILVFGVPGPEPRMWFPHFFPPMPRLLEREGAFFIPVLQRVPRRRPAHYGGGCFHRDFEYAFAELQPSDAKVLDEILMQFGISLIGCDPHTKYESRQHVAQRK